MQCFSGSGEWVRSKCDQLSSSSRGSWSPEFSDCRPPKNVTEDGGIKYGGGNCQSQSSSTKVTNKKTMKLDLDDYLRPKSNEAFLLEIWTQRHGINSEPELDLTQQAQGENNSINFTFLHIIYRLWSTMRRFIFFVLVICLHI